MTLTDYITEVKYEMADDNALVNSHHNITKIVFAINKARREINQDLKVYTKQFFISPLLAIDEYAIPADFLRSANVIDAKNGVRLIPAKQDESEILSDDIYEYRYGNLFYLNERKRKLVFLNPPDTDKIPRRYTISINKDRSVMQTNITDLSKTFTTETDTITNTKYWLVDSALPAEVIYDLSIGMKVYEGTTYIGLIKDIDYTNSKIKLNVETDFSKTVLTFKYDTGDITDYAFWKGYLKLMDINNTTHYIYCRYSLIEKLGDATNYEIRISQWNITDEAQNSVDYYNWTLIEFIPYVVNYIGTTTDLVMTTNETEDMPLDITKLVPIYASMLLYMREGRNDMAIVKQRNYLGMREEIVERMNEQKNEIYNKNLVTKKNSIYRRY